MMYENKENINVDQIQTQFTPKKSLRDIFSSISNSGIKTSPKSTRKSPKQRGSPAKRSPAIKRASALSHHSSLHNDSLSVSHSSHLDLNVPTLNAIPSKPIPQIPSYSLDELDDMPDTPGRSSIANYSFSYFHLPPNINLPPTPSRSNLNVTFSCDTFDNSDKSDVPYILQPNALNSTFNSYLNSSRVHDESSIENEIEERRAKEKEAKEKAAREKEAKERADREKAEREKAEMAKPKPLSTTSSNSVKFATPTKMRIPNPKQSAWAHSPFHKTPTKPVDYGAEQKPKENISLNLNGAFDDLLSDKIPRSSSTVACPKSSDIYLDEISTKSFKLPEPKPTYGGSLKLPSESSKPFEAAKQTGSLKLPSELKPLKSHPLPLPPTKETITLDTPLSSIPAPAKPSASTTSNKRSIMDPNFYAPSCKPIPNIQPDAKRARPNPLEVAFKLTRKTSADNLDTSISKKSATEATKKAAALPSSASATTKYKSTLDLDTSFQMPSKPKPAAMDLNTSLQIIPTKKTTTSSGVKATKPVIAEKTGIRRPTTVTAVTPKHRNANESVSLETSFSSTRSSRPTTTTSRPSLTPKKRPIDMDTSFSSITPKARKPRPSEIIGSSTTSLTPALASTRIAATNTPNPKDSVLIDTSKAKAKTPKKFTTVTSSGYGEGYKLAPPKPVPVAADASRIPTKKAKVEDKPKTPEEEFEQKLEQALQAGTMTGTNGGGLQRTPTMGRRAEANGNKWSPVRKRALTFEESVLVCTKKTKNEA